MHFTALIIAVFPPLGKGRILFYIKGNTPIGKKIVLINRVLFDKILLMKFTEPQLKLLAEILSNIGLIFFASMVAPFFAGKDFQEGFVFSGLFLSFGFIIFSLAIAKQTHL
ncbi:MAG: hypothetical protein PHF35_02745 [Candidatus Moranbacteria bacterium]|nr:hypothetical protein [Candidatus Moranbacteria bacterium]